MKNTILFIMFIFLTSCTGEEIGNALIEAAFDSDNYIDNKPHVIDRTGSVNIFYEEPGVYLSPNYPLEKRDPIRNVLIHQTSYTSDDLENIQPWEILQTGESDKNGEFTMTYTSGKSYSYFVDLDLTNYNSHTNVDESGLFKFVVFNKAPTTIRFKSIDPSIVITDNFLEYSIQRPSSVGSIGNLISEDEELILQDGELMFDCAVKVNYDLRYRIKQTAEWKTFSFYRDEDTEEYEIWID